MSQQQDLINKLTDLEPIIVKLRAENEDLEKCLQSREAESGLVVENNSNSLGQCPRDTLDRISDAKVRKELLPAVCAKDESRFEQLQSVAEYAGRVAHDFNNILQTLLSGVQFVLDDEESRFSDESRIILSRLISMLRGESERIKLIRDFAGVKTRKSKQDTFSVNLSSVAKEVSDHYYNLQKKDDQHRGRSTNIETDLCSACPVNAKIDNLKTIILNLLDNASDSMPAGGTIRLATSVSDQFGILEICDEGCGIDEKNLVKIFEPFWTTKKEKPSGTGLSNVFGLLKSLDGKIFVTSEPGKGTRISVILPLVVQTTKGHDKKNVDS